MRSKLVELFGQNLHLKHSFTFREVSSQIVSEYEIKNEVKSYDDLDKNLRSFLERIAISYIHPQESKELLEQAQLKLKNRLLSNWGRNAAIAETLKQLQSSWDDLRSKANNYLSAGLTNSLQDIWPGCSTTVDLPEKIEEIVGISEILFRGESTMPNVSLTSQGTGAQSTILYQTHFLLDSDRSLHRGFYYPIWLLEEPESFLHADIISKLGQLLNSDSWLTNIQMVISTHSPILLAASHKSANISNWNLLENHSIKRSKTVTEWSDEEIEEIGVLMGDPNFKVYFEVSLDENLIFIEDKREHTKTKLEEAGIVITKALNGATELRRYFNVLRSLEFIQSNNSFFLVDNDDGLKEFTNVLEDSKIQSQTTSGFRRYGFENGVFLVVFPPGHAFEDLFSEYDEFLESCANQIFSADYQVATTKQIPANLSRVHAHIRNKRSSGLEDAKDLIKKHQDVKDSFWNKVSAEGLKLSATYVKEIKSLIE